MANEPIRGDDGEMLEPEDVNAAPAAGAPRTPLRDRVIDSAAADSGLADSGLSDGVLADSGAPDPADEIPVPIAMSPAEIDERAQAVEAVRGKQDLEPRIDV